MCIWTRSVCIYKRMEKKVGNPASLERSIHGNAGRDADCSPWRGTGKGGKAALTCAEKYRFEVEEKLPFSVQQILTAHFFLGVSVGLIPRSFVVGRRGAGKLPI